MACREAVAVVKEDTGRASARMQDLRGEDPRAQRDAPFDAGADECIDDAVRLDDRFAREERAAMACAQGRFEVSRLRRRDDAGFPAPCSLCLDEIDEVRGVFVAEGDTQRAYGSVLEVGAASLRELR